MSPIRFREEESSLGGVVASLAVGALAGFAVGVIVAQKSGGISGITGRIRRRFAALGEHEGDVHEHEDAHRHAGYDDDELEDEELADSPDPTLEEEVLVAFQSDPVLGERAIDIAALGDGVIELSGWVDDEAEVDRATSVARRVEGVESVVNRLSAGEDETPMRDDEDEGDASARGAAAGDDTNAPIEGGRWEGQRVGTGRRRQGTSDEPDRHADPRPTLEDRWLDEEHAIREAAGDIEGVAERRRRAKKPPKSDRAGGGPISPGGVPKGDHVADPDAGLDVDPNV